MKTILFVLAILLLSIMVTGVAVGQTEIVVWAADNETGACWSSWLAENFASDDIMIEVVLQPSTTINETQRVAILGGTGPDIVSTHGPSFMLELALADLLTPLDDYADHFGWHERFVPWALNIGRVNDQIYSLSTELETIIVWYNKTLFEEHGWEIPNTMDEFFALGEQVRAAGLIPFAPAFGEFPAGIQWYVGVFFSHYAGPELVYEALTGQREWTDPAFAEAIAKLNEIVQDGWFMGSLDLYFSDTFDSAHAQFGAGDIAMNIEGTWFQSSVNDFFGEAAGNNNEWDWFPIPTTFTDDPFYIIGVGSSWGINDNSSVQDAAAEVLDFYFSPAAQAAFFDCGLAPAPLNYEGNVFENADPRIASIYESFGEASSAGNYGYTNWSFWPAQTNLWMFEGLAMLHDGQITVEEYLSRMQAEFEPEFEAGYVPPIPER